MRNPLRELITRLREAVESKGIIDKTVGLWKGYGIPPEINFQKLAEFYKTDAMVYRAVEMLAGMVLIFGNSYLEKIMDRRRLTGLKRLPADTIKIDRDKKGKSATSSNMLKGRRLLLSSPKIMCGLASLQRTKIS